MDLEKRLAEIEEKLKELDAEVKTLRSRLDKTDAPKFTHSPDSGIGLCPKCGIVLTMWKTDVVGTTLMSSDKPLCSGCGKDPKDCQCEPEK